MVKTYTVAEADTLTKISVRFYGNPARWPEIVNANPQLSGRRKAADGSPYIYVGDVLIIPNGDESSVKAAGESVLLDKNAKKDLGLSGQGKLFTGFTAYTLVRNVNGVDGFSFSSSWDYESAALRNMFRPFSYPVFDVYFDDDLVFKGVLMPPTPEVKPNAETLNVQGYPLCGVLVDSCLPPSLFPAEYNGMNVREIAETICEPFGITVVVQGDVGEVFEKVEASLEDKCWDFLQKLCEQRGLYMTNTADGSLLIYKPEIEAVSATFIQGEQPFISCTPEFDGQKMYSHITGYTKTTEENDSEKYTYENKALIRKGVLRCYGKAIEDAEGGTLEQGVLSLAGRMFGECVKYKLVVSGYRDRNGKLYRENMAVSVKAPGCEIYRETKFLADQVSMKRDDQGGETTEFLLILPGSRTGQLPEVFPWEE